jgi:hypothetical protein
MGIRAQRFLCGAVALFAASAPGFAATVGGANITTYHYDNLRTGWNQAETALTAAAVGSASFGLQAQVAVDEQVDAQPLFVSNQTIAGQGAHDVVYVATENNSIYAIDANSGAILLRQNYGPPVPVGALPGGCNNNSNNMGINSTPVIDLAAGLLYAITYTYENSVPVFRVHAVSLSTLQDTVVPAPAIGGKGYLKNGRTLPFVAANNRQRAGLIETAGNIYAGFASWCDINANVSHGWVLGWNTGTLTPVAASELVNQLARTQDNFFLSSVWMSGFGIASDDNGSLYFVTGNTDYNARSYNSTYNLAESVVKLSTDLTTVQGFFTPTGTSGWRFLDSVDGDFGSAGVLLLPDQGGTYPHLAVAAGKTGPMYLLNRDNLGGEVGPHRTLGTYNNNGCWCGPSYYVGADGTPRVVESTGGNLDIWKVVTSPKTGLVYDTGSGISTGQDPGFFTTISSNGTQAGSHVIWAVGRPTNGSTWAVTLNAFDPANGAALLYQSPSTAAGTWPFGGSANANLVPVVANGHVFVGSYQNLSIFGLSPPGAHPKVALREPPHPAMPVFAGAPHQIYGVVTAVAGDTITLRPRTGVPMVVNVGPARAASAYAPAAVGQASLVRGDYKDGGFVARYVLHAKPQAALWGADR